MGVWGVHVPSTELHMQRNNVMLLPGRREVPVLRVHAEMRCRDRQTPAAHCGGQGQGKDSVTVPG